MKLFFGKQSFVFGLAGLVMIAGCGGSAPSIDTDDMDTHDEEQCLVTKEAQRKKHIEARIADLHRRMNARHAVLKRLVEGRIDLIEAAAHFRAFLRQSPAAAHAQAQLETRYPGQSEAERHCRQVIAYLRESPEYTENDRVAARLEKELEERLRGGSVIRLREDIAD